MVEVTALRNSRLLRRPQAWGLLSWGSSPGRTSRPL